MTQPVNRRGRATVQVLANAASAAARAAELFVESAAGAITARRRFNVALAGGATPRAMYTLLADKTHFDVDWPHVGVFFTDERCVPPDDQASNYRMAAEALLGHVNVCPNCVHRMEGEHGAAAAAGRYESVLRDHFADDNDRFDFVLLGMGADGHTASLFPGTEGLQVTDARCHGNPVPALGTERVTLTYRSINAARRIVFLVTGSAKAVTLCKVLTGPVEVERLPAQGIRPTDGDLFWVVDDEAAASLPTAFRGERCEKGFSH